MLSPLFFAQAGAPLARPASGAPAEMMQQFGIEWPFLIMQLISFGILAYVLYRFMIKPVLSTVDERARIIAAGLDYTEQMKAQLAATQTQTEAVLRSAQQQAQAIVAEAQRVAKEFAEKQQREAVEQSAHLLAKAQDAIELEKRKMLADARKEIARLVVATTEQVLATQLSDSERTRYNEAAAKELSGVN